MASAARSIRRTGLVGKGLPPLKRIIYPLEFAARSSATTETAFNSAHRDFESAAALGKYF